MALLMKADGSSGIVNPKDGSNFTLEELQKLVGGYIENIYFHTPYQGMNICIVNEEAILKDLPINLHATPIIAKHSNLRMWNGVILGDVLFANFKKEIK